MAMDLLIVLIVVIFTLFTYYICCYDSSEKKRGGRYREGNANLPRGSIDDNVFAQAPNPARYRNQNPVPIGFNVTTHAPSATVPPVGMAPSAPSQFPTPYPPQSITPYPPVQAPYPVTDSHSFPKPRNPSAPLEDDSQPPSYYEATRQSEQHRY